MESSRTHFEVLGLEASSPRKLLCPRLEDSTTFEPLKFRWKTPETLRKICKDLFLVSSSRDRLKKNFWRPFSPEKKFWRPFFFGEHLRLCPWSLALASRGSVLGLEIFCDLGLDLGLEPCVLDSTSGKVSHVPFKTQKDHHSNEYFLTISSTAPIRVLKGSA